MWTIGKRAEMVGHKKEEQQKNQKEIFGNSNKLLAATALPQPVITYYSFWGCSIFVWDVTRILD